MKQDLSTLKLLNSQFLMFLKCAYECAVIGCYSNENIKAKKQLRHNEIKLCK